MVFGKQDRGKGWLFNAGKRGKFFAQHRFQEELFLEPDRQGGDKRPPAARRKREIRLQEPLELHERFIVKDNRAEVLDRTVRLAQTVTYSITREAWVVFFPRKPLFLRRSKYCPIAYHTGGAIMIKG
jgi:hypothetical protein